MIADFFDYLGTTNYHRIALGLTAVCVCIGVGVGFPVSASEAKSQADADESRFFTVFSKWQMEVTTTFSNARALAGSLASFASALAVRPANMSAPPAQRMDILDPVAFRRTAANLARDVPGITSLALSSGGVLSQAFSRRATNFGFDLYNSAAYHNVFNKIMVDGLPAGVGPNPLQSRSGIAVYSFYPVFVSNVTSPSNFWGAALATTEIEDLLASMNISQLTDVDGMEYVLWYEEAASSKLTVVTTSDPAMTNTVIVEGKRMRLPIGEAGKTSYLGMYPRKGPSSPTIKAREVIVVIFSTFVGSAAVALSVYLVLLALFAYRHRHAPPKPNSRPSERSLEVDRVATATVQVSVQPAGGASYKSPLSSNSSSSFIYFAVVSLRGAQPIFERAPLDALRMFTYFISRVRSEAEANKCYTMCEIGDRSVYVVAESAENILRFARKCVENIALTVASGEEDGPTSKRRGVVALTSTKRGGDMSKAGEGLHYRDHSESDAGSFNKSARSERSVSRGRSYGNGNNNNNNNSKANGGTTALSHAISRDISFVSARATSTSGANDRSAAEIMRDKKQHKNDDESYLSQSQSQYKKNNDNTTDDEATRRTGDAPSSSKLCQITSSSSFISTAVCQPSVTVHAVPRMLVRIAESPTKNNSGGNNAQEGSEGRTSFAVAAYTRLYDATRNVYFFSAGEAALATLCSTVDEARSGEVALTVDMQSAAPDACETLAESALALHLISTEEGILDDDYDDNQKYAKETKNTKKDNNNNSPAVRVLRWTPETGNERDDEDPSVAMASITDVYLKRMMVLADRNRKHNNSKHNAAMMERRGGKGDGHFLSKLGEGRDSGSNGKHSGSGSATNNSATTITRSATVLCIYFSPTMFTATGANSSNNGGGIALGVGFNTNRAAALLDTVRRVVEREKGAVVSANGSTLFAAFNLLAAGGHHQIRAANCVLALREAIPFSICPFVCSLHHGKVSALIAGEGLVMCTGPTVTTSNNLLLRAIALLEKTNNICNSSEEVCTLPLTDVHGLCVLFCAAEMSSAFECEAIDVDQNDVQTGTAAAASTLHEQTRRRVMYRLAHRKTIETKDDEWMYRLKNDEDDGVFSRVNTVFTLIAEGRLEEAREMQVEAKNELVVSASAIAMRQLSHLLL